MPRKRGKKYEEAAKKVEAALASNGDGGLDPEAAVKMVRETSTSKFDATVEAHVRLGVDPRHGRAPERHRQEGTRRGLRAGRQGSRGPGGGRRLRRRGRAGQAGPGGL